MHQGAILNNSYANKLKKITKREVLIKDILELINNRELMPGNRLLPAREFAAQYQINLRTALAALKELVEAEILDNIPRKGYFVRQDIELPVKLQADSVRTIEHRDYDPGLLLDPIPRSRRLALYISDASRGQLMVWEKILADFRRRQPGINLEVLNGNDGHIQDILAERQVDVIHSSAKLLNRCRDDGYEFINLRDLRAIGLDKTSLLPCVQRFMERDYNFFGIPFALDMHFTFINRQLADKVACWLKKPEAFDDLLPPRESVAQMLANGIAPPDYRLFYLLKAGGGIKFPGERFRIEINFDKILGILGKIRNANLKLNNNGNTLATPLFTSGKYPFLFHRGYMVSQLMDSPQVDWPFELRASYSESRWNDLLFLGINGNTGYLHESLELARHLCSLESQTKFTSTAGRLPIRHRALLESSVLDGEFVPREDVLETMEKTEIAPPFTSEESIFEEEINHCGESFQAGLMNEDEVFARIEFMHEHYFTEKMVV
jgi:hypothetical protein